ncbi:MAG: hypothetical protein OXB93_03095, partial [Cytophagales bacterium]|nr:hypothetical protein [Cytophagales bacterium]
QARDLVREKVLEKEILLKNCEKTKRSVLLCDVYVEKESLAKLLLDANLALEYDPEREKAELDRKRKNRRSYQKKQKGSCGKKDRNWGNRGCCKRGGKAYSRQDKQQKDQQGSKESK